MFQSLSKEHCHKSVWAILAVLTALGAALRVYRLGLQSLWFDELCSWYNASHSTLHGVLYHDIIWNLYPPGYGLLLHFVEYHLGATEFLLRMPSAIAGVLAIPTLFVVGARLYAPEEGLLASGLLTVLLFPLYFSQEARPYALLLFLVLLTTAFWTYVAEPLFNGDRPPYWAVTGYLLSAIACCYIHYFGLLFVAVQGAETVLFLGLSRKFRSVVYALALGLITVLAFAPWLPGMWTQLKNQNFGPQNPPVETGPVHAYYDYLSSLFNQGQTTLPTSHAITLIVAAMMIAVATHATWWRVRSTPDKTPKKRALSRAVIITSWLFIPFAFAYIKSVTGASVFTDRNLIVSLPAVYLLTARAFTRIPWRRGLREGLAVVILALFLYRTAFASGYYTTPCKDQFRETVAFVLDHQRQYPNALIVGWSNFAFPYNYYFMRWGSYRRIDLLAGRRSDIPKLVRAIHNRDAQYIWYLCADPFPDRAFSQFLNANFTVIAAQRALRVDAYLLKVKPALLFGQGIRQPDP